MDMDKTEKNQEKFTCGEFEYQVIRSARKTMTLEVRRDGNVIVRPCTAPYRSAADQKICKPEAGVGSGMSGTDKRIPGTEAAERRSERIETKCLYTKSKRNDYQKSFLFCQTHGRFLPQYHHQRAKNEMGKL